MNPYLELKRILGTGSMNLTGTVLAVDGAAVRVQTARGMIDAKNVDATIYRVGDEVLLRDGIVQRRVTSSANVPVYFV